MIRHLVLFTLAATDEQQRAADAAGVIERLEALNGRIPGMRSLVVRPDIGTAGHADLALVSEHDSAEAVAAYQAHPLHQEAAAWVSTVVSGRTVVDYEL